MDTLFKPVTGGAAAPSTLVDHYRRIEKFFQDNAVSQLTMAIPQHGLTASLGSPIAFVKKTIAQTDKILCPMELTWSFSPDTGLVRVLRQELTRPASIHLDIEKVPGFTYLVKAKQNIVVSRLVVDINDLPATINLLTSEANRVLILYCKNSVT